MFKKLFIICVLVQLVLSRPQITYKDGTFGVNFGGYHAEAGLGGLLTGDASHGGLHASAGTPYGQQAGAGIGGSVNGNGRTGGGGYAGASAGHGIGASAAFGGGLNSETGGGGGVGAESHIPGQSTKVVKLAQVPSDQTITIVKTINHNAPSESQTSIFTRSNVNDDNNNDEAEAQKPKKNEVANVDSKAEEPQTVITKTRTQPSANSANIDYRNFFDFGYFTNAAALYGGPSSSQYNPQYVHVQKSYGPGPSVTVHSQYFPPSPQNLPIRPKHIRKHYSRPRFQIQKYFGPSVSAAPKPNINTRINDDDETSNVHGGQTTYTKTVGVRGGASSGLIDDIFNIPISTLKAVNRLLSNGAQTVANNVGYQKSVSFYG